MISDLEDLSYDMDDVLDEFATEALRRKVMEEPRASTSKVRKFIPNCCTSFNPSTLVSDFRMRLKMDEINEITKRLQDLFDRRKGLGLESINATGSGKAPQRRPTSALIIEPCLYGRDNDKKAILELLLSDQSGSNKVGVVPIVGMGGVGKTTLAQMVYNDEMVDEHFEMKAWICVSEVFDIVGVTKAILEFVTKRTCEFKALAQVQDELKKALAGKKFLIVLDDVWNKNHSDWSSLKSPFNDGAIGSKIIVTTRSRDAANTMAGANRYHFLTELSEDDCWSVFVQNAFEDTSMATNQNLVSTGQEIIKKCKGLPLAARTLGGLLRCKLTEDEWKGVLNSKIWELSEEESHILPDLRLSYYHLPSDLKKCFAYCSILPKDYEFDEEELVFLWMAEGLIQKQTGERQMEDLGYSLQKMPPKIGKLTSLQTLSNFIVGNGGGSTIIELGNLIYLRGTLSISRLQNVTDALDAKRANLKDKQGLNVLMMEWSNVFDNARNGSVESKVLDMREPHKNLKELSINGYGGLTFPKWVGNSLFCNMVCLKIKNCEKCTSLPPLGQLPSLAKLYIQGMKAVHNVGLEFYGLGRPNPFPALEILTFDDMPEWKDWTPFGAEKGAQAFACLSELSIKRCSKLLHELPRNLPRLRNLDIEECTLCIDSCPSLMYLSSGSGLPPALKELTVERCAELKSLIADEGIKINCPSLQSVEIGWCDRLKTLPDVMQNNNGLKNLSRLEIWSCENLESLPEGWFPTTNFREFSISTCEKLEPLPHRPYQNLTSVEELFLRGFPTEDELLSFPSSLVHLCIWRCPRLISFKDFENLVSLEKLHIGVCPELTSISELRLPPSLSELRMFDCPNLASFPEQGLPPSLSNLNISGCPELTSFPEQGLPPSLSDLGINECPNLASFPEQGLPHSLLRLSINKCPILKRRCEKRKGQYWRFIAHIPQVMIDGEFVFNPSC
ncbi:hypothetical protein RHMOL_Rhmol01G0050100 [Rhododendron molle]|uniref:Uncharacterized protein n=1 Tax=Rhododendron molle TaxID=49168 RepID=A0ACC0Q1G0_RHOML|nr:hypothetical protein RHMOL_Rhmol01G0050100 [Rhododendron molle]